MLANRLVEIFQSRSLYIDSKNLDGVSVSGTSANSKSTSKGDAFIAYKGVNHDLHDFVGDAFAHGASLAIVEQRQAFDSLSGPAILVENARAAWAYAASALEGNPQDHLTMIAVTGTNGKTSSVWYLGELCRLCQVDHATVGTLGLGINGELIPSPHTTPDPDKLYGFLSRARRSGCRYVFMETSSIAFEQMKLLPINFQGGIWTSFSQDHLDYHGDMGAYFNAKAKIFGHIDPNIHPFYICSSVTPPKGADDLPSGLLRYGGDGEASGYSYKIEHTSPGAMRASFHLGEKTLRVNLGFSGSHLAENLLATLALLQSLGIEPSAETIAKLPPVPGRLEPVDTKKDFFLFVDYAHTPDALEKTLANLTKMPHNKILVVFGCGGNRDEKKRPIMGKIAAAQADQIWITNDNPRNEDPRLIADQIASGCSDKAKLHIILDRREAIASAIKAAQRGDLILIAGKGHENYQIIGSETLEFSDVDMAKELLKENQH